MDKRVKYSLKQKLSVVQAIKFGRESCLSASKKMGCNFTTIRRWIKLYREHGKAGLSLRQGTYDDKFKLQVVKHMLKKSLSLKQTAVIFGIPQEGTVSKWLQRYINHGAEGLKETRGRPRTAMAKKTKKTSKQPTDPAEKKLAALQQEVEYLRAENAFLKKLDALIQEEEATLNQVKRPKPLKN